MKERSYLEYVGRELVCFFVGHKWKYAETIKTDLYGKDVYHRFGNPYFKSVASWDVMCRRCRKHDVGFGRFVWYVVIYHAFKYSLQDFWFWINVTLDDADKVKAITVFPIYTVLSAVFHSIGQWFAQLDEFDLPGFLWDAPMSIAFSIQEKMWKLYDEKSASILDSGGV